MKMNPYYAAGIFDGEGFVYIFKKERLNHVGYYVSAGVNMCHYPTVKVFHDDFGGHLNSGRDPISPKHRPIFAWGVTGKAAASFLEYIKHYSLIKEDEVNVALTLHYHIQQNKYVSPGRNHMTERPDRDGILAYREELYQRCKALKQRSFAPLLRKGPSLSGKSLGRPLKR